MLVEVELLSQLDSPAFCPTQASLVQESQRAFKGFDYIGIYE